VQTLVNLKAILDQERPDIDVVIDLSQVVIYFIIP
jgi:hypothetical protein